MTTSDRKIQELEDKIKALTAKLDSKVGSIKQFSAIKKFRETLIRNKNKSRYGPPPIGITISMSDTLSSDALADTYDFFWYDLEHGMGFSLEKVRNHIMVAHGKNTVALVRIPAPNDNGNNSTLYGRDIKRALDMNADGIIVPQINTAQDVKNIVSDCRYPLTEYDINILNARRGFGPTIPSNYGRIELYKHLKEANENIFVCVMIESKQAFENIDEICCVKGLDAIVIGPNDLSASLGIPYNPNTQIVKNAMNKIIDVAKKNGKYVMWSRNDVDWAIKLIKQKGVDMVKIGNDVANLVAFSNNVVNYYKSKL